MLQLLLQLLLLRTYTRILLLRPSAGRARALAADLLYRIAYSTVEFVQ